VTRAWASVPCTRAPSQRGANATVGPLLAADAVQAARLAPALGVAIPAPAALGHPLHALAAVALGAVALARPPIASGATRADLPAAWGRGRAGAARRGRSRAARRGRAARVVRATAANTAAARAGGAVLAFGVAKPAPPAAGHPLDALAVVARGAVTPARAPAAAGPARLGCGRRRRGRPAIPAAAPTGVDGRGLKGRKRHVGRFHERAPAAAARRPVRTPQRALGVLGQTPVRRGRRGDAGEGSGARRAGERPALAARLGRVGVGGKGQAAAGRAGACARALGAGVDHVGGDGAGCSRHNGGEDEQQRQPGGQSGGAAVDHGDGEGRRGGASRCCKQRRERKR